MSEKHIMQSAGCACCSGAAHSLRPHDDECCGHGETGKTKLIRLLAGAVVFATGMVSEHISADTGHIPLILFASAFVISGCDVVLNALKNIARGRVFDENFLMSIATVGAFIIGQYSEGAAVMLFFQVGEYFQGRAVQRSKKAIAELMDVRPDFANLKKDGHITKVAPETVNAGDIILIKPGEKVPLDGIVAEGESMLDMRALTGESVPRGAATGDPVLSGCVNQSGLLTVKVTKPFGESTVSKIIELVESASEKKAKTENFITKFARVYTPAVVILAALIAVLPPFLAVGTWSEWLHRGLIFLVISCPCALVISIPLSFFGGIGNASRKGILVKGGNYLEALDKLDLVVFDKTGTLTKGVFKITGIMPANGYGAGELLALAANAEAFSNHPIAQSVTREYDGEVDRNMITDYREIPGRGVSVNMNGDTVIAGNQSLMVGAGIAFENSQGIGTKVYVAENGVFAGCITISDEIKPDSYSAIAALKEKGVRKTVMLTGDDPLIADMIAGELGLDEVHGGLLPHEKVEKLEALNAQRRVNGKLAFVGDGINDAPVLAMADIGVSMGALGSDAAIEAADVVLMTDEPSKLAEAVDIARFTKRIVRQNIALALGIKGVFLLFGALGMATMWEAVFADVGVCLLAIFNAVRIIRR